MPISCFSYSADVPSDVRNRADVQRTLRDLPVASGRNPTRPNTVCFSYSADLPLGIRNRNAAQPTPRDSRLCFSYY